MEAKQYIREYIKKCTESEHDLKPAPEVYNLFVKEANGECTWSYFRTLYNNLVKVNNVRPFSVSLQTPQVTAVQEPEVEKVLEYSSKSYDNDDKIELFNETINFKC